MTVYYLDITIIAFINVQDWVQHMTSVLSFTSTLHTIHTHYWSMPVPTIYHVSKLPLTGLLYTCS